MCTVDTDKIQDQIWPCSGKNLRFVAPALVDFLGAISLDAPAVVGHHVSVPSTLIAMFRSHEILTEPLPLFITNSPWVIGEFIKVTMKEMQFDTHFTPKVAIS